MPRGDGMGPPRGSGSGGGRMGGMRPGSGPGGNCVCPKCGASVPHQRGVPCYELNCPQCGTKMVKR